MAECGLAVGRRRRDAKDGCSKTGPGRARHLRQLQVDRIEQHDARDACGDHQQFHSADQPAGGVSRHRAAGARPRQHQLSALGDHRLHDRDRRAGGLLRPAGRPARPGAHVQPGLRDLHGRCTGARPAARAGRFRRNLPHRRPRHPRDRRGADHGEFNRHPHRCLPPEGARLRPRHQRGGGDRRPVPRPRHRRAARRHQLAAGVLGERPDRAHRHHLGLSEAAGRADPHRARGHRLGRQPDLRARHRLHPQRDHLRHPALWP